MLLGPGQFDSSMVPNRQPASHRWPCGWTSPYINRSRITNERKLNQEKDQVIKTNLHSTCMGPLSQLWQWHEHHWSRVKFCHSCSPSILPMKIDLNCKQFCGILYELSNSVQCRRCMDKSLNICYCKSSSRYSNCKHLYMFFWKKKKIVTSNQTL